MFGLPGISHAKLLNGRCLRRIVIPIPRDTDETGKTTLGLSLGTTWEGGEPTQPPSPTLESLTSGPYAAKYGTLDQLGQVGLVFVLNLFIAFHRLSGSFRQC